MNEYQMLALAAQPESGGRGARKSSRPRRTTTTEHEKHRAKERELMAKHDLADNTYRSIKADLDSKTSFYNIAVEHVGRETREARKQQLQIRSEATRQRSEGSASPAHQGAG